jgi:hypothetical protein
MKHQNEGKKKKKGDAKHIENNHKERKKQNNKCVW